MPDFAGPVRRFLTYVADGWHLKAEQMRAEAHAWLATHPEPEWGDTFVGQGVKLKLAMADLIDGLVGRSHA